MMTSTKKRKGNIQESQDQELDGLLVNKQGVTGFDHGDR